MSQEILQSIIDEFSPAKFSRLFRDKNRSFASQQETMDQYNDESFKDGLKLGEIKFSKTEKLIVSAFKVKKSLSERSGKKAQYEKGKKILKDTQSDAGIFIFYDPEDNFRFSLIYPETFGARRQWSNFRRFTYFVSREFTNKTYLARIGDEDFSSLEKIKEAFSVEKVTKEFYQGYRKLFENLVVDLSSNHTFLNQAAKYDINTENFAKKLLGQIVFIYFIQKKGWMGVSVGGNWGDGDKNFLSNLFKKSVAKKENFFNDYLEKLFYGTLNNPRRNAVDPSFSRDFNCRIPFLNGGLFEAEYNWKNSLIYLDTNIFKNIFEVFDRFNFTVEEESPNDKEIAVDPEMLGKVFENLLPENLRKGKGTYYTPREIVYYMCQESLINYLDVNSKLGREKTEKCVKVLKEDGDILSDKETVEIDNLLRKIKICDPACGSGAFLVGMLNEVVRLRLLLRLLHPLKLSKKSEYELKKETIQNCIYGVDIDPGAIEIAKLRLWLSLVVDYEVEDIEPLPNLDYRIMCGNSLLEEFEGVTFYNGEDEKQEPTLFVDTRKHDKIAELKKKVEEYFDIHDDEEKPKKRKEINDIKDWLIRTALEKRKKEISTQKKREQDKVNMLDKKSREKYFSGWGNKFLAEAKINEVLENLHNPKKAKPFFIWKLEFIDIFEEKGGFDVMIANPPYVKEYVNKSAFDGLRNSSYYQGKMDLWYLFACMGIDISRHNSGVVTFIAQNNWVTSHGASKMRNKVIKDSQILSLIDFGDFKIFDAGIQTMVMMFKKNTDLDSYSFDYRRLHGNDLAFRDVVSLLNKDNSVNAEYLTPTIIRKNFIDKTLTFSSSDIELILGKISSKKDFHLDPKKEVAQGIVCPQDYVNKSSQKILGANFKVGDGVFILSDNELKALKLSKKELSLVKPFYTTDELNRWWGDVENKKWIIYTDSSFKNKKKIEEYPAIKEHLHRFKKIITSDNKPYGLHRARDEYFFKGAKIIVVRKCARPIFTYTDFDSYVTATFYVIKTERVDQQFLTGLLNSKLIAFWLKHRGKMQGTNYQIDKDPIIGLPILKAGQSSQNSIRIIIAKIIDILRSKGGNEKQVRVREYERQIDQMVYGLYRLTKDEIKIVENFNK